MRLEGKVAITMGAARGIGAETARAFLREGPRFLLGDVRNVVHAFTAGHIVPGAPGTY